MFAEVEHHGRLVLRLPSQTDEHALAEPVLVRRLDAKLPVDPVGPYPRAIDDAARAGLGGLPAQLVTQFQPPMLVASGITAALQRRVVECDLSGRSVPRDPVQYKPTVGIVEHPLLEQDRAVGTAVRLD